MNWNLRFLSAVQELCSNAPSTISVPGCEDSVGKFSKTTFHNLHSILYHDVQVSWTDAFHVSGFKIEAGVNNPLRHQSAGLLHVHIERLRCRHPRSAGRVLERQGDVQVLRLASRPPRCTAGGLGRMCLRIVRQARAV